jgi:hypothetical protein
MKITATFAVLAWAILLHPSAAALADDSKTIDCGDTSLKFDAPSYTTKCYDWSDSTVMVDSVLAARKLLELVAYSDTDETFVDVIDNRDLGGIYLLRRTLDADIEGYFNNISVKNWHPGSSGSGFEIAEFDGGPKNGEAMDCVGFRRGVTPRGPGFGRIVVGIACSSAGRRKDYDAIAHLKAPGA